MESTDRTGRNRLDETEVLERSGRKVLAQLQLDEQLVCDILGVDAPTAKGYLAGGPLSASPEQRRRLLQLVRVFWNLARMFGDESFGTSRAHGPALRWLNGHNRAFGAAPVEHMRTPEGLDAVVGYLESANI